MVTVTIVEKSEFKVCGRKTWISGQHNEEFGEFWSSSHQNGLVSTLKTISEPLVMNRGLMGISRVEKDPANRAFFFYICCEKNQCSDEMQLESFSVPAAKWAVFSNHGDNQAAALIEAEMYCHMEWLKNSGYTHANAPEIEMYPESDGTLVEYWLPIC